MGFNDNERIQEIFLVAGDWVASVGRGWWYALLFTILAIVPGYYAARAGFVALANSKYQPPKIIYNSPVKQPLEILDKGIFDLGNNSYSGYVRIKNLEHDWGVPKQEYVAEFKTLGGTLVTRVNGSIFILPSSEKLIIFSRFTAEQKPTEISFSLAESHFIHKPEVFFDFALERISIKNQPEGLIVSAGIKNLTAFTVSQINLPAVVYDAKNNVVAVNYTYINDVKSGETRTFQYAWPVAASSGTLRAEISPEINIFDRKVFENEAGVSPFENLSR